MKTLRDRTLLFGLLTGFLITSPVFGATVIVSDNFTAVNVNSGFALGEGVNSGINPPTTRLTGTAAPDLHYVRRAAKGDSPYTISGNKCNITQGLSTGRFTLSNDATTNAFDFGPALGVANATPTNPLVYDVGISMDNNVSTNDTSIGRMSFAFGTVEGGTPAWSFGIQIIPTTNGNYNVFKRIKIAASGLAADQNTLITNAGANASEVAFLMRFTDAGAESGADYHSRVQVSMDAGATWFYDTQSDTNLTNGFRFDLATRFVSFDQAPNGGLDVYDNFSISLISPLIWTGAGPDGYWSTGADWLKGIAPVTGPTVAIGDALVFSGTTQPANTNDFSALSVSSVTLSNGGFSLFGNPFTLTTAITNITGNNSLNTDLFLGANSRFQPNAGTLTFNGGILSTGRTLTVSGSGSTIINGTIDTGGALTKTTTAGTLTLNGTNLYPGTTTVSQGLLTLNGSINSTNTVVSAAGILGGTGTVNGPVTVSGSLSAGNGIGKLTTGSLSLTNNGTNIFEISSVTGTAGVQWDLVDAGANNVDVQAPNTAPFKFRLIATGLSNFNKDTTYAWPAISGTVQNFSADKFAVVNTGFTNDLAGGTFSIESTGNGLNVRYVNNQGPSASSTNFTFAAGSPFQVSIADLLTDRTSDPDGDARVLVSVTSTNASVSTNATNITITSANSSTESIAYVVKDARNYKAGDTVRMATNYINIVVTNNAGGGVLTINNNGGNASVNFVGNPNQVYVIQRSQYLTNWSDIATNTANGSGLIQFSEVPPYNPAFYRTRTQP